MTIQYKLDSYQSIAILDGFELRDVSTTDIYALLEKTGVVLIRNSIKTPQDFSSFVQKHSSKLSLDPARKMIGNAAQLVDAGNQAVGLHCENGNSPFWPDLTWFYCSEAPTIGSQTTVCDGVKVLKDMSHNTRSIFENQDIRYSRRVEGSKWRRLVCHYNDSFNDPSKVSINDLLNIIAEDRGTHIEYNTSDDSIQYTYTVSAIQKSSFSSLPAFANSILGPSYNYETPVIDLANGQSIIESAIDEIKIVSQKHTIPIGWQDHDLVMIDNKRVMHGREEIIDTRRVIYNALSYRK